MSNKPFTANDAVELLWPFVQDLFKDRMQEVRKAPLRKELEETANEALLKLSESPFLGVASSPIDIQRLMYEKIVMTITALMLEPQMALSDDFALCYSDDERLSLLLRGEVVSMNLRALTKQ